VATAHQNPVQEAVSGSAEAPPVVPLRHRGRLLAALLVGFLGVCLLQAVARNPNFEWSVVGQYLFDSRILDGLRTTLILTALTMIGATVLGLVLALMRQSSNLVLSSVSRFYLGFFRGVPLLVQILFWFNLAALFPTITLGVPFGGPTLLEANTNSIITPWSAALIALILDESGYLAEIIRAGMSSVDRGQREAARALGMHGGLELRRIILPQAMRVMVPPYGNEMITVLKGTSLVSVIALEDLLYSGQVIYGQTFQTIPILVAVSIWYLVFVIGLTVVQGVVERKLGTSERGGESTKAFWRRALTVRGGT